MSASSDRRRSSARGVWSASGALVCGALVACTDPPVELPVFVPSTPHEAYEFSFRRVGLETTALGFRWIRSSVRSLEEALPVSPPHLEAGYFDPTEATAHAYRLNLTRGQLLVVDLEIQGAAPLVFVDLFRVVEDSLRPFRHEAHADSGATRFEHLVRRSGEYVLRLQPEMLAVGEFEIRLLSQASLSFPVEGHDTRSIRSRFGAARDGGRREHHGVDIFARRGTPVLAASDGTIRSTRPNRLGGKVVWLRDRWGQSLYYAHLDSVHVRRGMPVLAGDTVGFVGNSGNARTTPPHLHFGIYSRGPTDPYPYIHEPRAVPPVLTADRGRVGQLARTSEAIALRENPGRRARMVEQVDRHVPVQVLAASADLFRVRLPDSTMGFLPARAVEPLDRVGGSGTVSGAVALRDRPEVGGLTIAPVRAGQAVNVLGTFADHHLVRVMEGHTGWVPVGALVPPVTSGVVTDGR